MTPRPCIVTMAHGEYRVGTVVMLRSFLRHNPWFDGDLIVVGDEPEDSVLRDYFPRLRFEPVSPELSHAINRAVELNPRLDRYRSSFHRLELFQLNDKKLQYTHVICIDPDMLFLDSIENIFTMDAPLTCCGEREYYLSQGLDPETFKSVPLAEADGRTLLERPFNAGFMVIQSELLNRYNYDALVGLVAAMPWGTLAQSMMADQVVLNMHFSSTANIVSGRYNYLLPIGRLISARESIRYNDIHAVHFQGPIKPWRPDTALTHAARSSPETLAAARAWSNEYHDVMEGIHLRAVRMHRR